MAEAELPGVVAPESEHATTLSQHERRLGPGGRRDGFHAFQASGSASSLPISQPQLAPVVGAPHEQASSIRPRQRVRVPRRDADNAVEARDSPGRVGAASSLQTELAARVGAERPDRPVASQDQAVLAPRGDVNRVVDARDGSRKRPVASAEAELTAPVVSPSPDRAVGRDDQGMPLSRRDGGRSSPQRLKKGQTGHHGHERAHPQIQAHLRAGIRKGRGVRYSCEIAAKGSWYRSATRRPPTGWRVIPVWERPESRRESSPLSTENTLC